MPEGRLQRTRDAYIGTEFAPPFTLTDVIHALPPLPARPSWVETDASGHSRQVFGDMSFLRPSDPGDER